MKTQALIAAGLLATAISLPAAAENKPVGVTPELMSVTVNHNGTEMEIVRNQDNSATVNPAFAKTSRPCPPFCVQPMSLADGVETLGEIELLDWISRMAGGDDSIMLIDSRTPDWVERGTIPGAVNIPWTELATAKGATTAGITQVLTERFGAKVAEGADEFAIDEAIAGGEVGSVFDYSGAKTLVLFCNGMWCGQSPTNIRTLLTFGYPEDKIKWYRGGMQAWEILGFATAKP